MPAIGTRWIVTPAVGSRWLDPLPTDPVQRDCEVADVLVMVRYDDLPNTPVKYTAREFANRFRPHEVHEGDNLCKVCARKLQHPCCSQAIDPAPCVVCGRVTGCAAEAKPAPLPATAAEDGEKKLREKVVSLARDVASASGDHDAHEAADAIIAAVRENGGRS